MTRFEQLCSVEQETCSVWLDQEHATVVGLRWPGGGRAFVCLTKHTEGDQRAYDSMGLGWMGRPATQRRDTVGYHLYVINDKKKPQSVFTLQMVESDRAMYSRHQERTAAGCQSLRALLRAVPVAKDQSGLGLGLRDDALALLLLSGARAAAGQLALDNASKEVTRKKLLALSKSLEDARTFDPWFNTTGKSVAGSIGNNVRLFAWTSTHVPSSADAAFAPSTDVAEGDGAAGSSKALGKRKAAKLAKEPTPVPTPATAQLVKAIDGFAPKSEAAARKPAFKMAKLMDPEPTGVDRHAAWGGDCGLFHAFSQDLFVSLLERCDCHTRLLLTEMVSKSFRMLRFEPELFASLTLNHCPSLKMSAQLWAAGRARAISCPAQHFANILQSRRSVVEHLSFRGGKTPLSAYKACLQLVGGQLRSLSLYGERTPNALTLKAIGKSCVHLTALDLSCGKGLSGDDASEALLEAVRHMPKLQLLRVPPFGHPLSTFIGPWSRVKETTFYRDAEVEEDYCSMPVDVDDHDFTAGSEGDFGAAYVPEYDLLRKLQAVLPRRCKLTNNGLWLAGPFMFEDCGTPKNDAPEWHLFGGSSFKHLMAPQKEQRFDPVTRALTSQEPMPWYGYALGSNGAMIKRGLVKTVYLQCGDPDELAVNGGTPPQRFYTCLDDWQAANPEPEVQAPLGPIILT